jgi:CubicO group peptidase (beta-lactamase class C family)
LADGGSVEAGYEAIHDAFAEAQAKDEGGAQLCVYRHGRKVVDLWAGRDPANGRAFGEDTLTAIMSCTKSATATAAHMLIERGQLDLDARVALYWPEFAAGGKDDVRVYEILAHAAGLMGFPPELGIGVRDMLDHRHIADALAAMEPLWRPGGAYLYHFFTFGFLVGEIVRRVTGRSIGQYFSDEIARPLALDMWIGLPQAEEHRIAPHFNRRSSLSETMWRDAFKGLGVDMNSRLMKTVLNTFMTTDALIDLLGTREGRAAEIPAANGIGTARALAKMHAALIGEVDGVRLVQTATMERARAQQNKGLRPPGEMKKFPGAQEQIFALGYELPTVTRPMLGPGSFGHTGAGGRVGFAHPESGIAVGYVCNAIVQSASGADPRWLGWTEALKRMI